MAKITVHRKGYLRRGYKRKDGTHVKATRIVALTFKVTDRGKRGRTPEFEQWYVPKVHMGWEKTQSATTRRRLALKTHRGNKLATARALMALSNVSTDRVTAQRAGADARYFFAKLKK